MIPRLSLYLDTSVINFLFAEDAPEKREITVDFFERYVRTGIYRTVISNFVTDEILQTPEEKKREKLLQTLVDYPVELLELSNQKQEIVSLADRYMERAVMPPRKYLDALHVACAVVQAIPYLVSWNYKHLANVNRERRVLAVNYEMGYTNSFRIVTPLELFDDGNN